MLFSRGSSLELFLPAPNPISTYEVSDNCSVTSQDLNPSLVIYRTRYYFSTFPRRVRTALLNYNGYLARSSSADSYVHADGQILSSVVIGYPHCNFYGGIEFYIHHKLRILEKVNWNSNRFKPIDIGLIHYVVEVIHKSNTPKSNRLKWIIHAVVFLLYGYLMSVTN